MCRKRNIDYYGICPECKVINDKMRGIFCNLNGKNALVTGGRIKIGYAVCLRLLRQGASVIAVTRYPKSALENYMQEPDYDVFKDKLSKVQIESEQLKKKLNDLTINPKNSKPYLNHPMEALRWISPK